MKLFHTWPRDLDPEALHDLDSLATACLGTPSFVFMRVVFEYPWTGSNLRSAFIRPLT